MNDHGSSRNKAIIEYNADASPLDGRYKECLTIYTEDDELDSMTEYFEQPYNLVNRVKNIGLLSNLTADR